MTFITVLAFSACGRAHAPLSATPASSAALAAGAPCDRAKDAYACTTDHAQVVVCDARRWRVAGKCGGAEHCVSTRTKLACDETLADVGAPCITEGDTACASDGAALLACVHGVMSETSRCRGAKGCAVLAGTPTCDRTTAEAGDRCDAEGEAACAPNREAIVECRSHVMVQTTVCHCRASGTEVRCE
jgi:hypothetical protein